eukprot:SAG22_NODE_13330_length_410_cov_0.868167_1_plen_136_part_11
MPMPDPRHSPPPQHWPFGPAATRMIDGAIGWSEALWGAYVWLAFVLAVLGQAEEGFALERRRRASWGWHPASPERARRMSSTALLGGGNPFSTTAQGISAEFGEPAAPSTPTTAPGTRHRRRRCARFFAACCVRQL